MWHRVLLLLQTETVQHYGPRLPVHITTPLPITADNGVLAVCFLDSATRVQDGGGYAAELHRLPPRVPDSGWLSVYF